MECPKCQNELSKDNEKIWCSKCGFILEIDLIKRIIESNEFSEILKLNNIKILGTVK